jgi:hypothetical protein
VLHYGLLFEVQHKGGKWSWDKHWYHGFNVHKCPPWDMTNDHPLEGLFPRPPGPSDLLDNVSYIAACSCWASCACCFCFADKAECCMRLTACQECSRESHTTPL